MCSAGGDGDNQTQEMVSQLLQEAMDTMITQPVDGGTLRDHSQQSGSVPVILAVVVKFLSILIHVFPFVSLHFLRLGSLQRSFVLIMCPAHLV